VQIDDGRDRPPGDADMLPAWRRRTIGEQRWNGGVAVLCMIVLQLFLPERLSLGGRWLLPVIELIIIAVLGAANPGRFERRSALLRMISLVLISVASLGNAWAAVRLVLDITITGKVGSAAQLLATGGDIWLINVVTFAVWYWELDRGGPLDRALGIQEHPDFLFPQMTVPDMAPKNWEPRFLDYAYLAFTNSTAFSPTDTLPLSRGAKVGMLLQSAISLIIAALVVAKAINALQ
jgi:uncharacterized membrane protein